MNLEIQFLKQKKQKLKKIFFDLPKDADENLRHKIELIINSNESLAENKIKNEIEQLFLKYKHGNNIHEKRMNHISLLTCPHRLQNFEYTCCSSNFINLLHVEKYKKAV